MIRESIEDAKAAFKTFTTTIIAIALGVMSWLFVQGQAELNEARQSVSEGLEAVSEALGVEEE